MYVPLSIEQAVSSYYSEIGPARFFLGSGMTAPEVFDRQAFLPVFAHMADTCSRIFFKRRLDAAFNADTGALFGYRVEFPEGATDSLTALLLINSIESVIGPPGDREIDLMPLWSYFSATPVDRARMNFPAWQQEQKAPDV